MKNKLVKYILITLCVICVIPVLSINHDYDPKEAECLVCEALIDEIKYEVNRLDPNRKVTVGNYRLDSDGNSKFNEVPIKKSEIHLAEILDGICERFDDYVKAKYKSDGRLTLIRLVGRDGKMNPESSLVEFIQEDTLNKNIKYYCTSIVEEYEDAIIKHFINETSDIDVKICSHEANICNFYNSQENDYNDEL